MCLFVVHDFGVVLESRTVSFSWYHLKVIIANSLIIWSSWNDPSLFYCILCYLTNCFVHSKFGFERFYKWRQAIMHIEVESDNSNFLHAIHKIWNLEHILCTLDGSLLCRWDSESAMTKIWKSQIQVLSRNTWQIIYLECQCRVQIWSGR